MENINEYVDRFFRPSNDGELKLGEVDRAVLNYFLNECVYKGVDLWDTEGRYRRLFGLLEEEIGSESVYANGLQSPEELSNMPEEKCLEYLKYLEEMFAMFVYVKRQVEKVASTGGVRLVP
tara:strand:+ start:8013 stop:8375 length:363 start_codon:yes stop_codon:yes gene_type:complete